MLATPGAAAGTAPVSYCVYMDGDTHTITLDAACLSRFTGPKKTPPGQAASAAAAALDGWVHHITLTGAPGAGKTATIDVLADAIRATGKYHVVTKPEVPTQVFASVGGFKKDWAGNAPLLLYLLKIESNTMTNPLDSRRRTCRRSIPVGLSFLVDARQTPLRELRKELFLPPTHT